MSFLALVLAWCRSWERFGKFTTKKISEKHRDSELRRDIVIEHFFVPFCDEHNNLNLKETVRYKYDEI